MLFATLAWVLILFVTFLAVGSGLASEDVQQGSDAYKAGAVIGSTIGFVIWAFFETGAYAVAMIVLMVVRFNRR